MSRVRRASGEVHVQNHEEGWQSLRLPAFEYFGRSVSFWGGLLCIRYTQWCPYPISWIRHSNLLNTCQSANIKIGQEPWFLARKLGSENNVTETLGLILSRTCCAPPISAQNEKRPTIATDRQPDT